MSTYLKMDLADMLKKKNQFEWPDSRFLFCSIQLNSKLFLRFGRFYIRLCSDKRLFMQTLALLHFEIQMCHSMWKMQNKQDQSWFSIFRFSVSEFGFFSPNIVLEWHFSFLEFINADINKAIGNSLLPLVFFHISWVASTSKQLAVLPIK